MQAVERSIGATQVQAQLVEARVSDISLINGVTCGRVEAPETVTDRGGPVRAEPAARPSDRADISDRARLLSRLAALPATRTDLVAAIRQQITDGTYETVDRLDEAVQNLLGEIDLPS